MSVQCATFTGADGFVRQVVTNAVMQVTYVPQLGGKISQITDRRSGRNWLWRHPRMPYQFNDPHASYVAVADSGGWDECFPTVGKCTYPTAPWQGVALADHGELWSQVPESQLTQTTDGVQIQTQWRGVALPYTFARTIHIGADAAITIDYQVHNTGAAPIQWIWCAHPLFAIAPGMVLETPAGTRFFRLASDKQLIVESPHAIQASATQTLDLHYLPLINAGFGVKLYSETLPQGAVTLRAHDGEIGMTWDVAEVQQLAIWLNAGAWSADNGQPYYNMGIEPAIGGYDRLDEAIAHTTSYAQLAPGQRRCWRLGITLRVDAHRRMR
ncbi:MAG: hypothetical protein ACK48C_15790 [Roseiflexaceae bacterium]